MKHTTFIFAGIMSAVIGNAYAAGENTVTSKSYVDAQDALKQNKIPAKSTADEYSNASLVEATGESGSITERKIFTNTSGFYNIDIEDDIYYSYVPTVGAVMQSIFDSEDNILDMTQSKIAKSGYTGYGERGELDDETGANSIGSWLNDRIKGSGLVTKTDTDGVIGERKIFEATDVLGYHAQNLTQIQKDIQDISIPTVGAMMTAISNGVNAATPTGTPNTIANYGANGELDSGIATYTGAAAYNATNDSAKIPTMAGVTTYAQAKMTCAGWPDGAAHTDANCWLWNKN